MITTEQQDDRPWWRYGYVWLIVAGPSAVIAAGAVTVVLAVRQPDPVLDDYYHQDRHAQSAGQREAKIQALTPAMNARNHTATGTLPQN